MSSFSDLPAELTTDILAAAIPQHPSPGYILAVNRCFNDIGQFIIYTSLRFKSESQLVKFALKRRFRSHRSRGHHAHHHKHHHHHHRHKTEGQEVDCDCAVGAGITLPGRLGTACDAKNRLPHFPRSISVRIPGGQGGGILFEGMKQVFQFCAEVVGVDILTLDNLELCLNSHTSDPAPWRIAEALSLVNPRKFMWTGPDPPHHFSIAIVASATYHLFQSMKSWSNLQSLTLTNISFPSSGAFVPVGSSGAHLTFCILANADEALSPLEALTNLRSVYIGKATVVPIRSIVKFALAQPKTKLVTCGRKGAGISYHGRDVEAGIQEIRLVDAYKESIWQERIRRRDLETIAMEVASSDSWYHAPSGEIDSDRVLRRIREIVACEALTERIMGGDRAEGMTTLI